MGKKDNVYGIDLKVLWHEPSKKEPGSGKMIKVVQWVYERGNTVKLEKRSYYTKDGKRLPGKAEGLGLKDLKLIHPFWKEVVAIMKNPPAPKPRPQEPAPRAEEQDMEEVPF